jgi:hypothetical protein
VQPTGRANARPMINSAIPINWSLADDGFRGAQPSYMLIGFLTKFASPRTAGNQFDLIEAGRILLK